MKSSKYKFFIFVNMVILLNSFNSYYLAQKKDNSIIKLFCLQSVKEEMLKAEMVYSEEIANETCDCYYEEFLQTSSHQDAKRNNYQNDSFETYKFNFGKFDGVRVANIISSICNSTNINGRSIGKIQIFNDYSLVDLPRDLHSETKNKLKKIKVRN